MLCDLYNYCELFVAVLLKSIKAIDMFRFSIIKDPRGATLKRGTQVTLHLKEEAYEFLEPDTLKELVHKYSQFINFSIYLWESKVSWYLFHFYVYL